jgi:hypothetical protein
VIGFGGDARIAVVVRPLDGLLRFMRLVLVPVVIGALGLPFLAPLATAFPDSAQPLGLVLAVIACGTISFGLLQGDVVGGRIDRQLANVRRRVAMACNHIDVEAHRESRIACRLTPELLRAPIFPYEEQRSAVADLLGACTTQDPDRRVWVLQGESGSGKTRTGLLFVQALVRDRRHYELGDRCFLYDFNGSPATQEEFVSLLGKRRHNDAIVLVDNVQAIGTKCLKSLTQYLANVQDGSGERLIVFLSRPSHAWQLGRGADVDFVIEAKARDCFRTLEGPRRETVEQSVSTIDQGASRLLGDLEQSATASAMQLHLAQIIARNHAVAPEVLGLLRLLAGQTNTVPADGLVPTVAILCALAAHQGRFTRRDVWNAAWVSSGKEPATALRLLLEFRRLHRLGFLSRAERGNAQYLFHEAVAQRCIDQFWSVNAFRDAFVAVARSRLARMPDEDNATAWLVATECGEQGTMVATFDVALANGSYDLMTACLARADARYTLTERSRLQLAILLNRIGDWTASRRMFADDRISTTTYTGDLAVMLLTSRMEATHDGDAEQALDELRKDDDPLVATIGEYWKIHMAAHRGEFASARLLELAERTRLALGERDSYWLVYSLARMHFDSLRHHYLEGGSPIDAIDSLPRRELDRSLRGPLPTYDALHLLYGQAHLIGHVLLPQLEIFRKPVTPEHARLAKVWAPDGEELTGDVLVRAALDRYRKAQQMFRQAGDREARYLAADVLNMRMVARDADLNAVEDALDVYEALSKRHFKLITSYPHFYRMRWHMLKYFRALSTTGDTHAADVHFAEAERRLALVHRDDHAVGNVYGVERAKLLRLLMDMVEKKKVAQKDLERLRDAMAARSYGFEARLLQHLLDRLGRGERITDTDLLRIFRCYPFVHQ